MIRIHARHLLPALLTSATLLVGYGSLQIVPPAASQTKPRAPQAQLAVTSATVTSQPIARTWMPPDVSKIPAGAEGESILYGMHLFEETPRYAPKNNTNELACGSCHLQGGTMSYGIALVGAPSWFPMWSVRAKKNITLEDRIQECETRSESGLPFEAGGREIKALSDYMQWITDQAAAQGVAPVRGVDAKIPDLKGDAVQGEAIFKQQCQQCHGEDGAGVNGVLPALWGPGSFNNGAGMGQAKKMAGFVLHNMPQNNPGKLTPQEAWDVSTYITSKPHSAYNPAYDIY
jgi:thiosulfate dehydrogenase